MSAKLLAVLRVIATLVGIGLAAVGIALALVDAGQATGATEQASIKLSQRAGQQPDDATSAAGRNTPTP